MNKIADRALMIAVASLCAAMTVPDKTIYVVLVGIISAGLCYFFYGKKAHMILCMITAVLIAVEEIYMFLIIVLIYETFFDFMDGRRKSIFIPSAAVVINIIKYIAAEDDMPVRIGAGHYGAAAVMAIGAFLAFYLAYYSSEIEKLRHANLRIRDDNEEFRQHMLEKNKLLRERQDNEIAMATLKERNRIAREIHDNVGHLLSRAIVQMGAVQAVNKDDKLSGTLRQVSATLGESMDKIRKSVHDLHNESFDLEKALNDIAGKNAGYDITLNYDMCMGTPLRVKYCVVSIVSEALHNVEKHSDATKVVITAAEHPGFYQIIINDNGHPARICESGIGLHNMESRIKELGGNMSVSTDKGFRIFCTVPKEKDENNERQGRYNESSDS